MTDNELFGISEQLESSSCGHKKDHVADPGKMVGDLISRQAALDALADYIHNVDRVYSTGKLTHDDCMDAAHSVLDALPSSQPNLSEVYSKAVFTWLMDYQIRVAELKGRYNPYEVLSWVINDWRKENG